MLAIPKLHLSEKIGEVVMCFCKLVALCVRKNCVKVLINITKFKQIKFEGVWRDFEPKNVFEALSFTIYSGQNAVFFK